VTYRKNPPLQLLLKFVGTNVDTIPDTNLSNQTLKTDAKARHPSFVEEKNELRDGLGAGHDPDWNLVVTDRKVLSSRGGLLEVGYDARDRSRCDPVQRESGK
jgi:hypothetical protein